MMVRCNETPTVSYWGGYEAVEASEENNKRETRRKQNNIYIYIYILLLLTQFVYKGYTPHRLHGKADRSGHR